jgi:DNA-binding NarL/FixJ family response regulator
MSSKHRGLLENCSSIKRLEYRRDDLTARQLDLMVINSKTRVAICETQPVTAAGLKCLVQGCNDLEFTADFQSLPRGSALGADVVVIDKAFGIQPVLSWLTETRLTPSRLSAIVWGTPITEPEALRFMQAGARGILRKTADVDTVLSCLRTVAKGQCWMEESVFQTALQPGRPSRSELTSREQQVLKLVEQGYRNRDIAATLGIRPGTVKIHMKHIFEKTGVQGRYGLALNGLRQRGVLLEPVPIGGEERVAALSRT